MDMDWHYPIVATATMLGCAVIGGVFFAFSSFVMTALLRLPPAKGIAAMQSINVVVINRSFLGTFLGTAFLSLGIIVMSLIDLSHPSAVLFLSGAIVYLIGTFAVTVFGNVPLNDQLAAVSAAEPDSVRVWQHYLPRWTMWNHVRTVAALIAALILAIGLLNSTG